MIELYHGDCLEVLKNVPDKSVDMVLTDPPYGVTACKWDNVIPFEPMWTELKRVVKDNGAICLFGSEPFSSHLRLSNLKMFKYDWVWRKSRPSGFFNAKKQPLRDLEFISVFYSEQVLYTPQSTEKCMIMHKMTEGRINNGSIFGKTGRKIGFHNQTQKNYPRQVLDFGSVHNVGSHPTQKPVDLLEYLIKTYTKENEIVLDFTMGSGSTGVACVNTGRKFIGIELDERYFKVASDRIMGAKNELA